MLFQKESCSGLYFLFQRAQKGDFDAAEDQAVADESARGVLVKCGDFLVPCTDELLHFVHDHISVPGTDCKQWEGPCNSESEIFRTGAVAIGTDSKFGDLSGYKLTVRGGITSEMLQICKAEWCDYVFSDSFNLMPLPEVAQYIQTNKHLPGCTPGLSIERAGGFSLGDEAVEQYARNILKTVQAN